ncbi:MAG: hypothetical protein MUP98_00425 [Candidatus Aminicenantes bacterium]|nr:hypothetical protein [Candidatus Aminicenantes bacterium]
MNSITIHSLDDELDKEIREKAKNQGTSLNKTIKRLLEKALGLKSTKELNRKDEFMDLFGVWSEKDYLEFTESTEDFNIVDPEDWK